MHKSNSIDQVKPENLKELKGTLVETGRQMGVSSSAVAKALDRRNIVTVHGFRLRDEEKNVPKLVPQQRDWERDGKTPQVPTLDFLAKSLWPLDRPPSN